MDKIPMTAGGLKQLEDELRHLKDNERLAVIRAISEAREHGDLSENAEYHAARERQSFIEGRIKELESIISYADIIDPSKMSGDVVRFGATVLLADEDTDEETVYQIVGQHESSIENGKLSIGAPLARGLIGKSLGDSVEVKTPGGSKSYEIVKVDYI
jgi:transcription elongation factor GreA